MISVDEAQRIVLSHTHVMSLEKVDLLTSLGRVIGEEIIAPFNIPPWNNSAMDGYAVRFDDIKNASFDKPTTLKVIEELPAGFLPKNQVGPMQATHIMTGAPIPPGADSVVRKEDTSFSGDNVYILAPPNKGENIRLAGENVMRGEKVIQARTVIRPPHIGMLASFSKSFIAVYQVPTVAILSTGDELIDIDEEGDSSKIINSNTYSLAAQVKECGAVPLMLGIARDDKREILAKITQGLSADVMLTTGGVSVGEYDFVKDVLEDIGGELKFWNVAMRPGKPTAFGLVADKLIFGLPGNPVSCMVCFEQFVRPALLKKMGHTHLFRSQIEAVLVDDVKTKKDLRFFIRVRLGFREGVLCATTTGDQGSGILKSMIQANGLMVVTEDKKEIKAGEKVRVQVLDHIFELENH
ncbi:MAG: molybdopterin molybdotransferase MoeA [Thermodesulfobacteriota bacterium]|nr:MAG: molybdopterin molybdotransferase MoeA [Thermodesulfobacteriota bacterium]